MLKISILCFTTEVWRITISSGKSTAFQGSLRERFI